MRRALLFTLIAGVALFVACSGEKKVTDPMDIAFDVASEQIDNDVQVSVAAATAPSDYVDGFVVTEDTSYTNGWWVVDYTAGDAYVLDSVQFTRNDTAVYDPRVTPIDRLHLIRNQTYDFGAGGSGWAGGAAYRFDLSATGMGQASGTLLISGACSYWWDATYVSDGDTITYDFDGDITFDTIEYGYTTDSTGHVFAHRYPTDGGLGMDLRRLADHDWLNDVTFEGDTLAWCYATSEGRHWGWWVALQ